MLDGHVHLVGQDDAVELETGVVPAAQRRDHALGIGDHVDVAKTGLRAFVGREPARLALATVVVLVCADREEHLRRQVVARFGAACLVVEHHVAVPPQRRAPDAVAAERAGFGEEHVRREQSAQ